MYVDTYNVKVQSLGRLFVLFLKCWSDFWSNNSNYILSWCMTGLLTVTAFYMSLFLTLGVWLLLLSSSKEIEKWLWTMSNEAFIWQIEIITLHYPATFFQWYKHIHIDLCMAIKGLETRQNETWTFIRRVTIFQKRINIALTYFFYALSLKSMWCWISAL